MVSQRFLLRLHYHTWHSERHKIYPMKDNCYYLKSLHGGRGGRRLPGHCLHWPVGGEGQKGLLLCLKAPCILYRHQIQTISFPSPLPSCGVKAGGLLGKSGLCRTSGQGTRNPSLLCPFSLWGSILPWGPARYSSLSLPHIAHLSHMTPAAPGPDRMSHSRPGCPVLHYYTSRWLFFLIRDQTATSDLWVHRDGEIWPGVDTMQPHFSIACFFV